MDTTWIYCDNLNCGEINNEIMKHKWYEISYNKRR